MLFLIYVQYSIEKIQCSYYSTCCQCVLKVGILDVDLCGPSIPRMLSIVHTDVHQCDSGWVPVYTDAQKTLALMSIGFLLEDPDEAVVWRGPKKTGMLSSQWKKRILTCSLHILLLCCIVSFP